MVAFSAMLAGVTDVTVVKVSPMDLAVDVVGIFARGPDCG